MSNDTRIVKFQMMIRDIWEDSGMFALTDNLGDTVWNEGYGAVWLSIIYDYDKLNDYGKVIMEQVCGMTEEDEEDDEDSFSHQLEFVKDCQKMEYRMNAARALVVELNDKDVDSKDVITNIIRDGKKKKLYFIFWSLMILAVDDTDKEEHLSLICDFAKMLRISDDEMMDIVQIIQAIYHMEGDFTIKTRDVKSYFEKVIKRYGVKVNTGALDEVPQSIMGMLGSYVAGRNWRTDDE